MTETIDIKSNTDKLINFVASKYEQGQLDNNSLIELFKAMGAYLNLETISAYAERTGLSYQGVKVTRKIETIFKTKFVIDND